MLIKPDHLSAFARLAGDSKFKEWLAQERETTIRAMKLAEGALMYRAQGKLQFIDELVEVLEKARTY